MNISNNYTSPQDQNIESLLVGNNKTTSIAVTAEPCAVQLPSVLTPTGTTTAIDNNFNQGVNITSRPAVDGALPPAITTTNSNFNTLNNLSNISTPSVYDQNLHVTTPAVSSAKTKDSSLRYSDNYSYPINVANTYSNYPNFGPDDPLGNPNRKQSQNSNLCDSPLWSLLTIPCPTCDGGKKQVLENKAGKKYIDLSAFFPRMPVAVRTVVGGVEDLLNGLIKSVDVTTLFHGGNCPTCKGKNTVKDPSGQSGVNAQKAKEHLDGKKEEIMKQEAKAGGSSGCGNRYTIIGGYDCHEVGLGMNNATSYRVDPKGGKVPGKVGVDVAQVAQHVDSPAVFGTNPPATPGGHYVVKCSNKFTCFTGAQGIELITHGPVNIAGGITKITGPEITVGSQTGPVTISGNHLQLTGNTVNLQATGGDSHVVVQGTMGITGNTVIGGGAHVEGDLSFTSGTAPSKISRTSFSSPIDQNTGQAKWGGEAAQAILKQTQNMVRDITFMATDPSLPIASTRGLEKIKDHIKMLAYLAVPFELLPTGWIIPGTEILLEATACPCNFNGTSAGTFKATVVTPIDLHNFPHQHQLPDMQHLHEMEVPNIKLLDTAKAVRQSAAGKEAPIPATNNNETDNNLISSVVGLGATATQGILAMV